MLKQINCVSVENTGYNASVEFYDAWINPGLLESVEICELSEHILTEKLKEKWDKTPVVGEPNYSHLVVYRLSMLSGKTYDLLKKEFEYLRLSLK